MFAAIVAMAAIMLLVALAGELVLIPSDVVREVDAVWLERGVALLHDRPRLVDLARAWSTLSGPWFVHPIVLLVGVCLLLSGRVRPRALLTFVIGIVGLALGALCKEIVERPRPLPEEPIVHYSSWSFPSGHATNIALGSVLLIVLLWSVRTAWIRWASTVLVLLGAVLTCLDRIALGVHYVSDVAAGLALGTAMALAGLTILLPDGVGAEDGDDTLQMRWWRPRATQKRPKAASPRATSVNR